MDRIETVRDYRLHFDPASGEIRVQGAKLHINTLGVAVPIEHMSQVIYPGDDLTPQPDSVKKLADAFWTDEMIEAGRARRRAEHNAAPIAELVAKLAAAEAGAGTTA